MNAERDMSMSQRAAAVGKVTVGRAPHWPYASITDSANYDYCIANGVKQYTHTLPK